MPRPLPWLVEKSNKQPAKRVSLPVSRDRAHLSSSHANEPPLRPSSDQERRARLSDNDDEPPSSPPLVNQAVEVEYMQEGLDADDRFRMVEDEFLATAKLFTRHLHADEYALHKKRVQARGVETINGLQRPTDGRTAQSGEVKLKRKAQSRSKAVRSAVSDFMSDGSVTDPEDDGMEMGSDLLADPFAGFAPVEDYKSVDLSAAVKSRVNTRAAAGFNKSPEKVVKYKDVVIHHIDDEEDSDDLDAVVVEASSRVHNSHKQHTVLPTEANASSFQGTSSSPRPRGMPDLLARETGRSAASAFLARRKAALEGKQKLEG